MALLQPASEKRLMSTVCLLDMFASSESGEELRCLAKLKKPTR